MTLRPAHLSLTVLALALTACGGSPEVGSGLASKIARSATRAVVDAIIDVDAGTSEEDRNEHAAEPLRLAATRPDAILETASVVTIEVAEAEAIPAEAENGRPVGVHIVTATVLPHFRSTCKEAVRLDGGFGADRVEHDSNVASPLSRSRTAKLTRI